MSVRCGFCHRAPSSQPSRRLSCRTCALASAQTLRMSLAATLIESETLREKIETSVANSIAGQATVDSIPNSKSIPLKSSPASGSSDFRNPSDSIEFTIPGGDSVDLNDVAQTVALWQCQRDIAAIQISLSAVSGERKNLRNRIKNLRDLVAHKRAIVRERTECAESATYNQERLVPNSAGKPLSKLETKADKLTRDVVLARKVRCREAGLLAGLKKRIRVDIEGVTHQEWILGKVQLWDLRQIHEADPVLLNASLANTANLVSRLAYYLGLKLPAQIILPKRDYPLPMILSPQSSYRLTSLSSSQYLPRPRALYLNVPLAKLKQNNKEFNSFLEGVALLAWDVAWLCRVSGAGSYSNWESICDIGRNLYDLLELARPDGPPSSFGKGDGSKRAAANLPPPVFISAQRAGSTLSHTNNSSSLSENSTHSPHLFGLYSHSMSLNFLEQSGPVAILEDWELASPNECIQQVQAAVTAEIMNREWEVLNSSDEDVLAAMMTDDHEPFSRDHDSQSGGLGTATSMRGSIGKRATTSVVPSAEKAKAEGAPVHSPNRLLPRRDSDLPPANHTTPPPRRLPSTSTSTRVASSIPTVLPSKGPSYLSFLGRKLANAATTVTSQAVSAVSAMSSAAGIADSRSATMGLEPEKRGASGGNRRPSLTGSKRNSIPGIWAGRDVSSSSPRRPSSSLGIPTNMSVMSDSTAISGTDSGTGSHLASGSGTASQAGSGSEATRDRKLTASNVPVSGSSLRKEIKKDTQPG